MALRGTWIEAALWVTTLASGAILVQAGMTVFTVERDNRLLARIANGEEIALHEGAPLNLVLARAQHLGRDGRVDEALALYQRLTNVAPAWRALANYNLGNLYLSQALAHVEVQQLDAAVPLVELCKGFYREALKADSRDWDAKANFELALRLVPNLERLDRAANDKDPNAEPLWTEVPGFPRGLP
jgi:mxaK protein